MKRSLFILLFIALPAWAKITIPANAELLAQLSAKLATKADNYYERSVKRIGNKTIAIEMYAVADGDFKIAPLVFGDFAHYRDWLLHNINNRPAGGGTYYLQMRDLVIKPPVMDVLVGTFVVDLPVFKKEMLRRFRMKSAHDKESFLVTAESIHMSDSVIGSGEGFMKVFPKPNNSTKLWYYLRGEVTLRNWLLYEALPDKLLARESGERIQTLLDNYLAQEEKMRAKVSRKAAGER